MRPLRRPPPPMPQTPPAPTDPISAASSAARPTPAPTPNPTPAPTPAVNRWWILTAIALGTFLSARDGSVVNTVQPVLVRELHSDVSTIQWVLTIYLLVVSGLQLTFGRVGDMRGHKRVFVTGLITFMAASALCGIAGSPWVLIFARAIQAIGAAMLFACGPAILSQNFPPEMRGQALGVQLTMTYVGLTMGPLTGGWMSDRFGWQSVFLVNVPLSIPVLLLALRYIPADRPGVAKKFDVLGATLFIVGLVAFLTGLNRGSTWGWTNPVILLLIGVGVAALAAFMVVENRVPEPMLDMGLMRNRLFSLAGLSALLCYVGLYATLFLVPFYYMQGRQMSATHAGLVLASQPLAMALITFVSGAISDKIGTKWPTTLGMVLMAVGLFLLAGVNRTSSDFQVIVGLVIAGLGTGMFVSPNNSAMLGSAPKERRGIASGIMATARSVGMVLGFAMAGAIYTSVVATQGKTPEGAIAGVQAGFIGAAIVAILGALAAWVREPARKAAV